MFAFKDKVTAKRLGEPNAPRKEIDLFCQDENMLNLYLLALQEMQKNDDPTYLASNWSWFGLGRIHGGLKRDHNGANTRVLYDLLTSTGRGWQVKSRSDGEKPEEGSEEYGYCTHGSVLL